MKRGNPGSLATIISAMLLIWLQPAFSQFSQIELSSSRSATEVLENNLQRTTIYYSFGHLNAFEIKTEQHGNFTELILPGGYPVGEFGTPKLPAAKHLIQVPFGAEVDVRVVKYTTEEYRLDDYGLTYPMMPHQPSLRKDQDVNEMPFHFSAESYSKNRFVEPELATIEVLGVMRGIRIAHLTVAPVSYNPQSNTLRVFNNIEVEITYTGADQQLTDYIRASTFSPYFESIYTRVLNPFDTRNAFNQHPDLTKYPMGMIVVAPRAFESTLQPFLEWKTKQGYVLHVGYTDVVGTTPAAIRSYIQGIYNAATPENPAPTFVIVVGDHPSTMPASAIGAQSNVVTDLLYASMDGDMFPEMYHGRLSARNVQELQNQIDKILYYQKYEFTDPSYLNDVTLIAGEDGTWNPRIGQPTIHYGTQNYFNTANGFSTVNAYLNSYTGCYANERISVSLINFTAHCSPTSWSSPTLSVANVHAMTNTGKYPLAVGNCCQSSLFSNPESIGEAWVRAQNKGAVAYIGSAPNTYWFEDFYWAVGAFPIVGTNNGYVPTTQETTIGAYDAPFVSDYHAAGSKKFVGNLAVTVAHQSSWPTHVSSGPAYYWQAYHTFGDPSTYIYLKEGVQNTVSHLPIVPIGMSTYTVAALPGSYVAISKGGVLHGAALVDNTGEVQVPILPVLNGGNVTIVITRPKTIPYIIELPAAALEGPYVVLDNFVINGQPSYNQTISLDVTLKNVGADPSAAVTAVLIGEDPYITVLNASTPVQFQAMESGSENNTSTVANAFQMQISNDVPNAYQAAFQISVTDGTQTWLSNLRLNAFAPVFEIITPFVLDDSQGNENGRLDPGESAVITFTVKNKGGADAVNPIIEIAGNSPYLIIDSEVQQLEVIPAGEQILVSFPVHAHSSAIEGTFVELNLVVEDGHIDHATTTLIIGQVPEMQIGNGNNAATLYPFYNYYKANRSQMLYLASDFGAGEKIITEIGFDIMRFSNDYNNLPNFRILIKTTDISVMPNSFVNMDDATQVFFADAYQMPTALGWHIWDIADFTYDGTSNLIIEIAWGQLTHWTSSSTSYQVAGTTMPTNMVSHGHSDSVAPPAYPNFSNNNTNRPNLFVAFAAEVPEDAQPITFIVQGTSQQVIENASVKIGSLTQLTSETGETIFTLLPGDYSFSAFADGYLPLFNQQLVVGDQPQIVTVTLEETLNVTFKIFDPNGNEISDATITLNGNQYAAGQYNFQNMIAGTYNYLITHQDFLDYEDEFELLNESLEMNIILTPSNVFVEMIPGNFKMTVFPNPTRNNVFVRMQNGQGDIELSLMNYQGQIIDQRKISAQGIETTVQFSLNGFASGIYYLRVKNGSYVRIEKIILQ
jgi:hypothetical protein